LTNYSNTSTVFGFLLFTKEFLKVQIGMGGGTIFKVGGTNARQKNYRTFL